MGEILVDVTKEVVPKAIERLDEMEGRAWFHTVRTLVGKAAPIGEGASGWRMGTGNWTT